jgi:hypothetical protein
VEPPVSILIPARNAERWIGEVYGWMQRAFGLRLAKRTHTRAAAQQWDRMLCAIQG